MLLPVVLFPLYYIFPSQHVTLTGAIPGAVFAGSGWTLLGTAFGVYTTHAGSFQLYGVLGGVLLLLVWFYFADGSRDRQLQQGSLRETDQRATMSEADGQTDEQPDDSSGPDENGNGAGPNENGDGAGPDRDPTRRADVATLDDLDDLRQEIEAFEEEIEGRTVSRDELEGDLKQYVRGRMRRGHATGWGPYLVLLYGTVMTLGAFYFLGGPWALLAMLVIWLSTLGLYALMVLVGIATTTVGLPGRILDRLRNLR